MDQRIEHSHLEVRGLRLHLAHAGKGELGTVVFLHGFPEIWYSWRHQMIAVADAGFRAIAPDFRGYGLSDQPPDPENASWEDLTADLLAILDSLSIPKAFIVAKDFGALVSYNFVLAHAERVLGVITLGLPFFPYGLTLDKLPKGFYISRWMEAGRAEADFGRFDVKTVVRNIYILFSGSKFPNAREDQEIMDLVDATTPLPHWFTEEDLHAYAALYEKSGFQYPVQMPYMALSKDESTMDPKIQLPALLIMGEKDYILEWPGMEESIKRGEVKRFIPDLEITFIPEGTHFVQEQFPDQVNQLIISFLNRHK